MSLRPTRPKGTASGMVPERSCGLMAGLSSMLFLEGIVERLIPSKGSCLGRASRSGDSVALSSQPIQSLEMGSWYGFAKTGDSGESGEWAESPLKSAGS